MADAIKNVIFDVGGVLVEWKPLAILSSMLPDRDPALLFKQMRPAWLELNLGKLTESEAIAIYQKQLGLSEELLTSMMEEIKAYQQPIPGSLELLDRLASSGLSLYSITDNIREIIEYHRANSGFIAYFQDIIVSADVGLLKPDVRIYQHLLDKHDLNPAESVFIDDTSANVEAALSLGMHAFVFQDMAQCEQQLKSLGLEF